MARPRVALLSDVRGWAFHRNMLDLEEYLGERFEVDHYFVREWQGRDIPDLSHYDAVYSLYHRYGVEHLLPMSRTLGSLRSQWFDPERKGSINAEDAKIARAYAGFHVVNRSSFDELRPLCPDVRYLTDPVNMRRFPAATPERSEVIATWNGNARHTNSAGDDVKGFYSIIVPACNRTQTPLEFAEYHTARLDPDKMPAFYQRGNLAICMSLYEGASNSVMEAMASGQAIVATDVGNHREMHESMMREYGDSGIVLVDRSVASLVDALTRFRKDPGRLVDMGRLNRSEIERAWSWPIWSDRYAEFLAIPLHTSNEAKKDNRGATNMVIDLSAKVTVFFITTGEEIAARSWEELGRQDCTFQLKRIENVAPMSRAFQSMVEQCNTPYFVQVDADMVLKHTAIRCLYERIVREPPEVFMYAFMLWDAHLGRGIFGVKIYRTELMKRATYHDVQSCEQDHMKQLEAMGLRYAIPGWDDATLRPSSPQVQGAHGLSYDPRGAYERYLDLTEKYRDVGGSDWYAGYPYEFLKRLLGRELKSPHEETDLWAFIGAVCGLVTDLGQPRGEKDFTQPPRGYGEVRAHLVPPPRETIIYSTGRCNGMCPGCRRQAGSYIRTPDFTPEMTELLLRAFPSAKACCIAGFGEPTLNPHLPEIVRLLRDRQVCTGVITNGLDSVTSDGLLHPGLRQVDYVSFSLNSTNEAEHEQEYRVKDGWKKALRGIEAAHNAKIPVTLSFIVTRQSWGRIPQYLEIAKTLLGGQPGSRVALVNLLPHHDKTDDGGNRYFFDRVITTDSALYPSLDEYRQLATQLGLTVFAWPVPIRLDTPTNYLSRCPSPFVRVGVDGNGHVSGCSRITPPGPEWGSIVAQQGKVWMRSIQIRSLRRQLMGAEPLRWECRYCFGNWSDF